ncbi:MAG TPA: hypothetical protein VHG92_02770 [Afifellaceae bacterium]|nr:hypothetical protein [Afifellaceae bacterium]
MAEKLFADKSGWQIDTDRLKGKELTDEQAKIIVIQRLATMIDELSGAAVRLADAIEKQTRGF